MPICFKFFFSSITAISRVLKFICGQSAVPMCGGPEAIPLVTFGPTVRTYIGNIPAIRGTKLIERNREMGSSVPAGVYIGIVATLGPASGPAGRPTTNRQIGNVTGHRHAAAAGSLRQTEAVAGWQLDHPAFLRMPPTCARSVGTGACCTQIVDVTLTRKNVCPLYVSNILETADGFRVFYGNSAPWHCTGSHCSECTCPTSYPTRYMYI